MITIWITVGIQGEEGEKSGYAKESADIPKEHLDHLKPGLAEGLLEKLVAQAIRNYRERNKKTS